MRVLPFCDLPKCDITLTNIVAMHQYWGENGTYSCIGKPKKDHSLVYFFNASAEFTFLSGKSVLLKKGDIIYTPKGSEYTVRIFGRTGQTADSMILHFLLFDEENAPLCLNDTYEVITPPKHDRLMSLYHRISDLYESGLLCPAMAKSFAYELLFLTGSYSAEHALYEKRFWKIKDGIELLENSRTDTVSVAQAAELCGVSTNCFRTLFFDYCGKTPKDFLLEKKMHLAKQLLSENLLSVTEISEQLGFSDVYYFSKLFHRKTGQPPTLYAKENRT